MTQIQHRPKRPARRRRLTELFVRKVKPEDEEFLVWDEVQRGLVLRVHPSGTTTWYTIYSRHGRARWYKHGSAGAIGLAAARMLSAEVILAVAKGSDPAAERKSERGAGTFAELATRYVEEYAKKHNKSWRQGDALVRRFALPRWGKLQASSITRGDVKTMMARIEAPVLANQTKAAVSALFSWAIKEEIVQSNPCKLVETNPTRSRERVLSESELPQLWQAFGKLDAVRSVALKAILLLGQRPGEIAHMRREHIKDGWWELPGAPIATLGWPGTKNGESHRVWIPKAAQTLFGKPSPAGFVFAGPHGGPVNRLDSAMRDICTKLKIEPPVRPHDLRRTHGSTITGLGFGRDAMNRIQNHKEGGIADVYDRHRYEAESKNIMESVAGKIIATVEGHASDNVVKFSR
jgi:integrase